MTQRGQTNPPGQRKRPPESRHALSSSREAISREHPRIINSRDRQRFADRTGRITSGKGRGLFRSANHEEEEEYVDPRSLGDRTPKYSCEKS